MRGLRSTIALIVVLGGLAAYIYFVTWKQAPEESFRAEKVFASLQGDKIDELRVKSSAGETTTLKKASGGWLVEEPVKAAADETTASGITSNLASVEVVRVVDENPADLKVYGLATPRVEIAFKAAGDKEYQQLQIGDKAPTGGNTFAKLGNAKRVFLIGAYPEGEFDKSTFDLRDKTVVKFDRDKVDGVEVRNGGTTTIELSKRDGDWRITKPISALADFGSVEGLIGRLQTAQMKSIVTIDPTTADLKKYSLDKADRTITVGIGSAHATLLFGDRADDAAVYARDASKPMVVTVETSLADDLVKGTDDYRRKDIFTFRPYNADHLEITRNGQTVVLDRIKAPDENVADTWRRVSPTKKDVDKDDMNSVLSKLSIMRATSFVDSTTNTGVDKPEMSVAVKFEGKEERVTFGRAGDAAYASRPGDPGAAKLDSTDFGEALKAIDALAK